MPQYLVAIQLPDNYDPSLEGEEMIRDIHALNEELDAAGVRLFAGGFGTGKQGEVAAQAGQRRSDHHRRPIR